MKNLFKTLLLTLFLFLIYSSAIYAEEIKVYRVYNPISNEHLYTYSLEELNALTSGDWQDEGIGWFSPGEGDPVYRLYNPILANHLYTTDENEVNDLTTKDIWEKDFNGEPLFYSGGEIPIYRLYNKDLNGEHLLTTDENEYSTLAGRGWNQEGIALYASRIGYNNNDPNDNLNDDIIDLGDLQILLSNGTIEMQSDESGVVRSVDGKFTNKKVETTQDAKELLNAASSIFGEDFDASKGEITKDSLNNDSTNEEYFHYFPSVNGIPVEGSEIIIVTDSDNNVTGLFNSYDKSINRTNTTPSIDENRAYEIVLEDLAKNQKVIDFAHRLADSNQEVNTETIKANLKDVLEKSSELVILPSDNFENSENSQLAYKFYVDIDIIDDLNNHLRISKIYLVKANNDSGTIVAAYDSDETIQAQAPDVKNNTRSIEVSENGNDYIFRDSERNLETYILNKEAYKTFFGKTTYKYNYPGTIASAPIENFSSQANRHCVSIHANMEKVYDFYRNTLNRNSYDNHGTTIKTSYQNTGGNFNNAFWSSKIKQMVFGDSGNLDSAVDVAGHEFTHAVINCVIGDGNNKTLSYKNESGSLNESLADIMGALIENKNGNGFTNLGEDSDEIVRDMSNPKRFNQADNYSDLKTSWFPYDGNDNGYVHYNSGIFNYAFYLMYSDNDTSRISNETWAKIIYNSMYKLSTNAKFIDARRAILSTAKNFNLTSEETQAIKDAFDQVGIREKDLIRFVLTWGSEPRDLDSHLIGPYPNGLNNFYHIYYDNKEARTQDNAKKLLADLDYDDTTSYGPEVTTIYQLIPGEYKFCIYDYTNLGSSNSEELSNSEAKVEIYRGLSSTPLKTISIRPDQKGTYWNVCSIKINALSNNPEITEINEVSTNNPIR